MAEGLRDACYSGAEAEPAGEELCELVRMRLREFSLRPRYKLVCSVVLGAAQPGQGVRVVSRVWTPRRDGLASRRHNASFLRVATVHGLYCE